MTKVDAKSMQIRMEQIKKICDKEQSKVRGRCQGCPALIGKHQCQFDLGFAPYLWDDALKNGWWGNDEG